MPYTLTLLANGTIEDKKNQLIAELQTSQLCCLQEQKLTANGAQTEAIKLTINGDPEAINAWQQRKNELAERLGLDLVLQLDVSPVSHYKLAVFDMDSTLIRAEVIDELARHTGIAEQVATITARTMAGQLDFNSSFKQRMALLKGVDAQVLDTICQDLELMPGAIRLMQNLKARGLQLVIISGGFNYFAEKIKQRLGMDDAYANALVITDGILTGEVIPPVVDGNRKLALLEELATQHNIGLDQTIAVGDGANDIPMLQQAGIGVAIHAKPVVKPHADWVISQTGLDAMLYLFGLTDKELI